MANESKTLDKPELKGDDIVKLLLQLIRYDIPVLMLGASSIGKSYTFIALAEQFRLPHALLYVGSEKASNIEGIPKILGEKGQDRLEYFKPFWFPNSEEVNKLVSEGAAIYKKYIASDLKGQEQSAFIFENLSEALERVRTSQPKKGAKTMKVGSLELSASEIQALGCYLCTILGYGNYWVILDEIDKVEETDIDKYAPLLHIVRERRLKDWSMREINNGKGVDLTDKKSGWVKGNSYKNVAEYIDAEIASGSPQLLDTRIISIANETEDIEEALYRRFLTIEISDILILDENKLGEQRMSVRRCIESSLGDVIKAGTIFMGQKIDDVNLQWQFNFLPKIVNGVDKSGNAIAKDYMTLLQRENVVDGAFTNDVTKLKDTMLFKLLYDNFNQKTFKAAFECMAQELVKNQRGVDTSSADEFDRARAVIEEFMVEEELSPAETAEAIEDHLSTMFKGIKSEKGGSKGNRPQKNNADLHSWLEQLCAFIQVSLTNEDGRFVQKDLSQFLIPRLYRYFFKTLADEQSVIIDNVQNLHHQFNEFWSDMVAKGLSTSGIKFDSNTVQKAIYGRPKAKLETMSYDEQLNASKDGLFGFTELYENDDNAKAELYSKSIACKLMKRQESEVGLVKFFNLMYNANFGVTDRSGHLIANKDLAKNFLSSNKGLLYRIKLDDDFHSTLKNDVTETIKSLGDSAMGKNKANWVEKLLNQLRK